MNNIEVITQLITSIGFPIFMCLLMFKDSREKEDKHTEQIKMLSDSLNNTTTTLSECINNNTNAITLLLEHFRGD